MAKEPANRAERASPVLRPTKFGKRLRHFAYADTTDPADVIDRIEYQVSEDGGAMWTMLAYATSAVAGVHPADSAGRVNKPGIIVHLSIPLVGAIFRTVIEHRTGKALGAVAEERG